MAAKSAAARSATAPEELTLPVLDVLPEQVGNGTSAGVPQQRTIGSRPVQFNLSEEAYGKLVELKKSLGVSSKTEVFRLGLAVLSWVVEELSQKNHKIVAQRGPNNFVELAFPFLNIRNKP